MKKVIALLALFLLASCSVGKVVYISMDVDADEQSEILMELGSLSTLSGDTDNKFDQNWDKLLTMPLIDQLGAVSEAIQSGVDVPDNVVESITEQLSVKKKLPLTVKSVGKIHIDGNYPMRFVVDGVCGPDLGDKFKVTFSNGQELFVENPSRDVNTAPGRAYRPGCGITSHKDVKWAEFYSDREDNSQSITIEKM